MKKSFHPAIRALLRQCPDGLSTTDIAANIDGMKAACTARSSLESMPDAYIDRWVPKRGGIKNEWQAVWCVIVPPTNCPKPGSR